MSMKKYYESINNEFMALKDRITYLIGYTHHSTTGGYQEALLKDFIERYLPENIGISRGFVVFDQRNDILERRNALEYNSNEIDILLYDKTRPTLYKSKDLVIVDVHSVKGIIEVKGNLNSNMLEDTISKFKRNISKINEHKDEKIFSGIFAYKTANFSNNILDNLQSNIERDLNNVINHICLANDKFIKFWDYNPSNIEEENYNKWHLYKFDENLAMGYFIYNLITYFTDENDRLWFPEETKEVSLQVTRGIDDPL